MNNLFLRIARAFRSSAPESQESASEVPGRHASPAELGMNSDKPQKEGRGQRWSRRSKNWNGVGYVI